MSGLAVDGGTPVRTTPMPSWPYFADADLEAALKVLASGRVNYWTGAHGRAFEAEFAAATGTSHAVAVCNGTVALELALRAVGVQRGDEVIVPAATFIATASAVVACGGRPVVVDVDPASACLTADTVGEAITARTKAVVVVHLAGHPADIVPVLELARAHGLRVVEDCAQAHGAVHFGRKVGSLGDIAAWSFCHDKILTTAGEGGAVTTSDETLWRRCWEMKEHGKGWSAVHEREHPPGYRWLHESFGTNARMTEVQAAVGRSQLGMLDTWVARRRANAGVLLRALAGQPAVRVAEPPEGVEHSYYKFTAQLRPEQLAAGWTRDRVVEAVRAEGVPCLHGGCAEIYRERAFAAVPGTPAELPVAARLGRTSLMLLVHPTLSDADMADTAAALTKVLEVVTA
ncbi:DegT/DnrJ/EryC1/StrS aminotransferase family protein [Lentzea tibetensis]|uniref:DegT/DnrJ/EryC1/StrS aminotransferase family protein n=1 Tax=Lentzea tibetensis TaxID=2591470 RepID=A0A563EXM7_9PSEU|nr:DegT/DnrJ/EryC1/StrS aminotransferase family protein [Lentzea tibetensis]TWP52409.1 DegT/DnrJ/EryC1/StrS aminotransferase family protein [Lentzea tibetensis]